MQQFILQQSVERLQRLLDAETDAQLLSSIRRQLTQDRRQLALLTAERSGVHRANVSATVGAAERTALRARFEYEFQRSGDMCLLLDPGPGLAIIDVNAVFESTAMVRRDDVVGRPLFDVFPDNPGEPDADGVSSLYQSLCRVAETGRSHTMPIQRYDVRDPEGVWQERHWLPINVPIFDIGRRLAFILQQARPARPEEVAASRAAKSD